MQVKEEDRKRTIDIYEPFARITEFQVQSGYPATDIAWKVLKR